MDELDITSKEEGYENRNYLDIGRIKLNRKKEKEDTAALRTLYSDNKNNNNKCNLKAIFSGAISGLFDDGTDYFRIKNIPDNGESRLILQNLGLEVYGSVESIKSSARIFYLQAAARAEGEGVCLPLAKGWYPR